MSNFLTTIEERRSRRRWAEEWRRWWYSSSRRAVWNHWREAGALPSNQTSTHQETYKITFCNVATHWLALRVPYLYHNAIAMCWCPLKVVVISIAWLISLIDIWLISDIFKENIKQNITVCKCSLGQHSQLMRSHIAMQHNPSHWLARYCIRTALSQIRWPTSLTACEWTFNPSSVSTRLHRLVIVHNIDRPLSVCHKHVVLI